VVAARIKDGRLLRPFSNGGKLTGAGLGGWAIWAVVRESANAIEIEHFGTHDLRLTCARLCRKNGGDLEQIKFLLGHAWIQTTERYLGTEQEIAVAAIRWARLLVELKVPQHTFIAVIVSHSVLVHVGHCVRLLAPIEPEKRLTILLGESNCERVSVDA
jgi:Phage integrase family